MRMSKFFSQTIRENPSEADVTSHQLLLRAGFIRQVGVGIFSFLPLARRSLTKIENIIRQEINAIGGQEISMPVVQPADLWKESGRWYKIGSEMGRFMDKNNHEMVLVDDPWRSNRRFSAKRSPVISTASPIALSYSNKMA